MQITLKAARVNAGFTIREVAKEMKRDKNTIVAWEKNPSIIRNTEFEALCKLYKIEPKYIKGQEGELI